MDCERRRAYYGEPIDASDQGQIGEAVQRLALLSLVANIMRTGKWEVTLR
jgi:hypothetical protein